MDRLHAGMLSDSRQIVTQLHVLHQDDGEESAELLMAVFGSLQGRDSEDKFSG